MAGSRNLTAARRAIAAVLAAIPTALALAASSAGAVTIGQLAPAPVPECLAAIDRGPASTVSSGTSYIVPSTGGVSDWTLTSWSHNAAAGEGQVLTMKIFRKVADPNTYQVVAHDGPRPLTASTLNTFPVNVRVRAGDFLGNNGESPGLDSACVFATGDPGDTYLRRTGNLADAQSEPFTAQDSGLRLNISAELNPTNAFTLGNVARNKRKGTATITANVPNPGELTGSGKGVKASSAGRAEISKAVGAGPAQLTIRAKGKKRKKLNEAGKVKLNVAITYTPTGGDPSTQPRKLKLRKKL
jgi:hypothetical protein